MEHQKHHLQHNEGGGPHWAQDHGVDMQAEPTTWGDTLRLHRAKSQTLPWGAVTPDPVMVSMNAAQGNRAFDPVLQRFRDGGADASALEQQRAAAAATLEAAQVKRESISHGYNLVTHQSVRGGPKAAPPTPKYKNPGQSYTHDIISHAPYGGGAAGNGSGAAQTLGFTMDQTFERELWEKEQEALHGKREYDLLSNRYQYNHEERCAADADAAQRSAQTRMQERTFDPITMKLYNEAKESETAEKEAAATALQADRNAWRMRQPPSIKNSDALLYDLVSLQARKGCEAELAIKSFSTSTQAAIDMMNRTNEQRERGIALQDRDAERALNRKSMAPEMIRRTRGYDPITNTTFQGLGSDPPPPLRNPPLDNTMWSSLNRGAGMGMSAAEQKAALAGAPPEAVDPDAMRAAFLAQQFPAHHVRLQQDAAARRRAQLDGARVKAGAVSGFNAAGATAAERRAQQLLHGSAGVAAMQAASMRGAVAGQQQPQPRQRQRQRESHGLDFAHLRTEEEADGPQNENLRYTEFQKFYGQSDPNAPEDPKNENLRETEFARLYGESDPDAPGVLKNVSGRVTEYDKLYGVSGDEIKNPYDEALLLALTRSSLSGGVVPQVKPDAHVHAFGDVPYKGMHDPHFAEGVQQRGGPVPHEGFSGRRGTKVLMSAGGGARGARSRDTARNVLGF